MFSGSPYLLSAINQSQEGLTSACLTLLSCQQLLILFGRSCHSFLEPCAPAFFELSPQARIALEKETSGWLTSEQMDLTLLHFWRTPDLDDGSSN